MPDLDHISKYQPDNLSFSINCRLSVKYPEKRNQMNGSNEHLRLAS